MLADDLIEVHSRPREIPCFTRTYPGLTAESGYAAARSLHEHRLQNGWRAVGRKIGFTNTTIWERYGVHEPIWGTVYDRTLLLAEGDAANVPLDGLVQPRIEPEICVGLRSAPPRTREPRALLASIDWIAHSVELVQCHHREWKLTLPDCTAGNGLHGRLVVGSRIPIERLGNVAEELPKLELVLKKDQRVVDRGIGSNVLGSPLLALAYLVEVLAKDSAAAPLCAGEIITTGTLTDAHPVAAGERWSTELTGLPLPGLRVRFV